MNRRPVQNFRGIRAVLIHGADRNADILTDILDRLGVLVRRVDPLAQDGEDAAQALAAADLLLVDNDLPEALAMAASVQERDLPIVAVIGTETPGRLQRALDLAPVAVLSKPVRAAGIYTTLYVAVNAHRARVEQARAHAALEARHAARRFVIKAVTRVMAERGCDDDEAYRILRKESMRQRLTVEELAVRWLAEPPQLAKEA